MIPVHPQVTGEHVHGEYVFRDLTQIGEPIDIVDIFRRPQAAGVDEAIAVGAKAVWMQIGVINEEAAARAETAGGGLQVVMDAVRRSTFPGWTSRGSRHSQKAPPL